MDLADLYTAATKGDVNHLQNLTPDQISNLPSRLAPNRNTLLHVATEFHQLAFARAAVDACQTLLRQRNAVGDAPLHVAAREDLVDLVEFFIGFDQEMGLLRMVNWEGDTALHCAARVGNWKSVEKLAAADPELCKMENNGGESALYLAVAAGYWDVPPIIIKCAPQLASYKGVNGLTALHPALFYPNYDIEEIKSLVGWKNEMIEVQDSLGLTPLHYAALYGRTEAIKLFLEVKSTAIYILDANGESALHIAALQGHIDAMEQILNSCPDSCYLVDKKGRTPLHAAVLNDQRKAIKFILRKPMLAPLLNKSDVDGNMPLHLAAFFKLYDVIEILAKSSHVDLNFKNKEFLTALDVYNKHEKEGLRATVTRYLLSSSTGTVTMQHLAEKEIKKMNREVKLHTPPSDDSDQSTKRGQSLFTDKNNALEVNLLVATLVATVTFAAGFSMPGGNFQDKGKAVLTTEAAFKVFVIVNTVAFCSSVFAVLLQFHTSLTDHQQRVRYMGIASFFTTVAIVAMLIAFASGTHVVLTRSKTFSLAPWIICATFGFLYFALPFCDPGVEGFQFLRGPQKFVRGVIVRYI